MQINAAESPHAAAVRLKIDLDALAQGLPPRFDRLPANAGDILRMVPDARDGDYTIYLDPEDPSSAI